METCISVKNLKKSYHDQPALNDLSFTVEKGDFFGFLGPNGAGKTTTIRILTGILNLDNGEITVAGFLHKEREKIAQIIGVVPESRGMYEWMTAREYLDFFGRLYRIPPSKRKSKSDSLLKQFDLFSNKKKIGEYSRGMRQRLSLAKALINNPQILFLDEPTLGLDPQGQEDIQNLLLELNKNGITIFLSSHLLHEVSYLCSRIAIINEGKLVAEGSLDELHQKTSLQESYFIKMTGNILPDTDKTFSDQISKISSNADITSFVFSGDIIQANQMLNFLHSQNHKILEFRLQGSDLTDIFLSLTEKKRSN